MRQLLVAAGLLAGLFLLIPNVADAAPKPNPNRSDRATSVLQQIFGGGSESTGISAASSSGSSVPELDMNVAGSAMVLILGGVAYLSTRRREQH